jgi:hypothetical protein
VSDPRGERPVPLYADAATYLPGQLIRCPITVRNRHQGHMMVCGHALGRVGRGTAVTVIREARHAPRPDDPAVHHRCTGCRTDLVFLTQRHLDTSRDVA